MENRKFRLLTDIASQLMPLFFIGLAINNIFKHPGDPQLVEISIFTIIFFTVIASVSFTMAVVRYRRQGKSIHLGPDLKKERISQYAIVIAALVVGLAAFILG